MNKFVTEIALDHVHTKTEYFPLYSVYTQPVQLLFLWDFFLFVCCKNFGIVSKGKGHEKRKTMAKNNILYMVMYTSESSSILH